MSECLFESAPPLSLSMREIRERLDGYRYCCHMLFNEKALLSKQMGFLNIETAACLFNMTVLNLSLFHHFDKVSPLLLCRLRGSKTLAF